jgi:hypothetical protein
MGEAAGIAAELDLLEQLSAANAAFRPAAREIIEEIAGRAGLWRCGASVRRRAEFEPFSDTARTEPSFSGDVADGVSGVAQGSLRTGDNSRGIAKVPIRTATRSASGAGTRPTAYRVFSSRRSAPDRAPAGTPRSAWPPPNEAMRSAVHLTICR